MKAPAQTIEIQDTRITYTDEGSGPVIVLLHGHAYDRSMWNQQIPVLVERGWRVIAPDLRGFGDSEVTPGIVYTEEFADDLEALLAALAIDQAVVLGFSMAGQIAMDFSARHRGRVRALVICDSVPQAEDLQGRRRRNVAADGIITDGMGSYAEKVLGVMLSETTISQRPEVAATVKSMIAAAPADGSTAAMRGRAARKDFTQHLTTVDLPSLVIIGSDDVFDGGAGQRMAALLPRGTLITIEGAGHTPPMETPQEFTAALTQFLDTLD